MRWVSQVRLDLPNMTIPIPHSEEKWRDWARQVLNANSIIGVPIPTKVHYPNPEDWRQWAIFFTNIIFNQ